jgi:hypothetical protein
MPLLKTVSGTGLPEIEDVLLDHAEAIGRLERLIQLLTASGGVAGCYIGTVQTGGISEAIDDDTPGFGNIMIRQVYGEYFARDSGIVVPVLNIAKGTNGRIVAGKQIATMPILNKPGHQLVVLDPCPPT